MRGDSLSFNGELINSSETLSDIDKLLGGNFIYARIHVMDYNCLYLEESIEICEWSYRMMYGVGFGLDVASIRSEIKSLLIDNNYPMGSATVVLYIFPDSVDPCTRDTVERFHILSCREQLLYSGYTNWHSGVVADVLPYDIPFSYHQTSASLTAHRYAEDYARRRGAYIALRESSANIVVSASEYPLFGVVGREIRIASLNCGASDSIERVLTLSAASRLGLTIVEYPHTRIDLKRYDELFYVNSQGIVSIVECEGIVYPNIIGRKIGSELERLSLSPIKRFTTI